MVRPRTEVDIDFHCPHCGANPDFILLHGVTGKGTQRYKCEVCERTFVERTARKAERGKPLGVNYACPHKHRPHYAKGMCKSCYMETKRETIVYPAIRRYRRRLKERQEAAAAG